MSLDLDKRQRAMLREMGIRLWQPPSAALETAAPPRAAVMRAAASPTPAPTPAAAIATGASAAQGAPAAAGSMWTLGAARAVYEPAAGASARWLLLIETPADSAAGDPFAGDTGKLLDNMLRAAGLPNSNRAAWVPVQRLATAAGPDSGEPGLALAVSLSALVQAEKPDVLLIMGRLAAQALLQTAEPLGKLRGQKHQLAGVPAFVTYDAAYLLRSLPDKARAWDDFCLAQQLAPARAGPEEPT
jgi:uracil-DNA glycosylase family 4